MGHVAQRFHDSRVFLELPPQHSVALTSLQVPSARTWHNMTWYGMAWHDMAWHGMTQNTTEHESECQHDMKCPVKVNAYGQGTTLSCAAHPWSKEIEWLPLQTARPSLWWHCPPWQPRPNTCWPLWVRWRTGPVPPPLPHLQDAVSHCLHDHDSKQLLQP